MCIIGSVYEDELDCAIESCLADDKYTPHVKSLLNMTLNTSRL